MSLRTGQVEGLVYVHLYHIIMYGEGRGHVYIHLYQIIMYGADEGPSLYISISDHYVRGR